MKCIIPEISWHNRDPVLSVDIHPKVDKTSDGHELYRLATGGYDSHVSIWYLTPNEGGTSLLDIAADLTRHQRAVNAVKWSPNGQLLASGDDESVIFIWKQKGDGENTNICDDTNEGDKENWITMKILRGHMEDVYDLNWAPSSNYLISGSVDSSAIIWDVHKGKTISILNDHNNYVQGVAWDPCNQYLATMSSDRNMRIFDINTKKVLTRTSKSLLPVPEGHELFDKKVRLFHDDTLQTFFRRLDFSPDGNLLFTPSGVVDYEGCSKINHTTYVFSRFNFKQPVISLPSPEPEQYTVAIKCSPMLYKLRPHNEEKNKPVVPLPYRMIFAIATRSSVYLYDTQQKNPFAMISNIHYTRLTDLSWSSDGQILVVSSTDGFCSLITFAPGELGEMYEDQEIVFAKNNNKENLITNTKKKMKSSKRKRSPESKATPTAKKKLAISEESTLQRKPSISIDTKEPKTPPKITLSQEIVLDKDIISSEEKFESPEKKSRPITPISVRRHPRTPLGDSGKKPNPIAIRRQPRKISEKTPDEPAIIEDEAVDAWPLGEEMPDTSKTVAEPMETEDTQCTENIRLVYEESQDEVALEEKKDTKTPKTPRRVEFRTISTPKSKKKLDC
ncbi:CHAF1B family protein [Megaselia abdita]